MAHRLPPKAQPAARPWRGRWKTRCAASMSRRSTITRAGQRLKIATKSIISGGRTNAALAARLARPVQIQSGMSRKVHVKSFGCQMNVYDSHRMADTLAPGGFQETAAPEDADLVILNTCHIREKAGEKVYSERSEEHTSEL